MFSEFVLAYAESHTSVESPLLAKLNRETNLGQVYPRMLAGVMQGTFLKMISRMIRPSRILEVGTFTGYSALCLAEGLEDVKNGLLHTIEADPEKEDIIRKYISEAGLEHRIILHIGDAMTIIPELDETWDLAYIDADKPNYLHYYEMILPKIRKGGFILADNALWDGKVVKEGNMTDKETRGIQEFNDRVQKDENVENLLLPFRDGIMMIRKK